MHFFNYPEHPLFLYLNATDACQNYFVDTLYTGTHDIQNISVSSPIPGRVRVTGDFIQGSTATGVLVIIYSQSNDSDTHYVNSEYHGQNTEITVDGLTSGSQYGVSIFVLENGLPFSRVATLPQTLYTNITQQSTCIDCG